MRRHAMTVFAAVVVLAAGCGGGGESVADGAAVTITLTEFEFSPSDIVLNPGTTVTIELSNEGEKEHEFMVGREVHVEDGVPHGFESDFFDTVEDLTIEPEEALVTSMEGMAMDDESMADDSMSSTTMGDMGSDTTMGDMDSEEMEDMGVMVVREPTEAATITFTVTEASIGEWQIGCFEEDGAHWDDGMRGTITVEGG